MGEEDISSLNIMCIVSYSLLEFYHFLSPNIVLGESKLKSSNEDCKQETTTILLLFLPAHYPGQLGPHLQPAKIKLEDGRCD